MLCLGGFELYSRWLPLKKRSREEISCPVNRPSRGFAWSLLNIIQSTNLEEKDAGHSVSHQQTAGSYTVSLQNV